MKHAAYAVITVLLIFSLLGLCNYRSEDTSEVLKSWDAEGLVASPTGSLQVTNHGGSVSYEAIDADPQIWLFPDGKPVNFVKVHFAQAISEDHKPQLYYAEDGNLSESKSVFGKQVDAYTVIFVLPELESCNLLRLDMEGNFSLTSVEALDAAVTLERSLSTPSVILLLLILLVLVIFEKRIGYFAFLANPVRREVALARDLAVQRKPLRLLLHIAATLATLIFVGSVGAYIMLGIYTKKSILLAFLSVIVALILQLANKILNAEAKAADLFLLVTVLAGMMLCYTMPLQMLISWDDETHFLRTYHLAFFYQDDISISILNLFYRTHSLESYFVDPMLTIQNLEQWDLYRIAYTPGGLNPYMAISYLPGILSMNLSSLLQFDITTMLVVGKLANVLTYALVIYFGIRKLKSGALIFAAVTLLPSALFLACSYSYDFWLTAWMVFTFGQFLAVMQNKDQKFEVSNIIAILVGLLMACAPKAIYCVLFLPFLFLPKAKFTTAKMAKYFRIALLLCFVLIAATVIIPIIMVPDRYSDMRGGSEVNSWGQLSHILSAPFQYAWTLLKFLGSYVSVTNSVMFTTSYAYLGIPHVFFGTAAIFLLLYAVFTDRRDDDCYELMQPPRWLTLFASFAQIALIATSLYISFTPVGLNTVNGCQFRYIFPILIPFCFFMAPKKIRCEINRKFQYAFVFGGLALNILGSYYSIYITRFLA